MVYGIIFGYIKSMKYILAFALMSHLLLNAQHNKLGVVLDAQTREPLEFVEVHSKYDQTLTNEDGAYFISTNADSLIFYKMGYEKLTKPFHHLSDTIYLSSQAFELDEVTLSYTKTLWEKVRGNLKDNYRLEPLTEDFFLRCVQHKNGNLMRIQDLQGLVQRKTQLYTRKMEQTKKDFKVQLNHMRKVGIEKDSLNIYLKFPSFYSLMLDFLRINVTGEGFALVQKEYDDHYRIDFINDVDTTIQKTKGHYTINKLDYAITSFEMVNQFMGTPFTRNKFIDYKTTDYQIHIDFDYDDTNSKYYMKSAKSSAVVAIKAVDGTFSYATQLEFIYLVNTPFISKKIEKKINPHKDIFKLKHPYVKAYWHTQNTLLLTSVMKDFVKKMNTGDGGFSIRSNME